MVEIGPGITFGGGVQLTPAPVAAVANGSVSFNGSSQYLSLANTSAFNFGTADFTIEFWWRPTVNRKSDVLDFFDDTAAPISRLFIGTNFTTDNLEFYTDYVVNSGVAKITGPATSTLLNTWNHIAVTRQSGSMKMWLNGTQTGSTYSASVINFGSATGGMALYVMRDPLSGIDGSGNLSNIRVVKGTPVYTGTFTPPTSPLTATQSSGTNISAITAGQTQLLLNTTNDANFLKDSSSNNFTVTNAGSVSSSALNPF